MAEIININLELLLAGEIWSTFTSICHAASFCITNRRLGNDCT